MQIASDTASALEYTARSGLITLAGALQGDNITTLVKAAGLTIEPYWPGLFAKLFEKRSIGDLISNVGASELPEPVICLVPPAGCRRSGRTYGTCIQVMMCHAGGGGAAVAAGGGGGGGGGGGAAAGGAAEEEKKEEEKEEEEEDDVSALAPCFPQTLSTRLC